MRKIGKSQLAWPTFATHERGRHQKTTKRGLALPVKIISMEVQFLRVMARNHFKFMPKFVNIVIINTGSATPSKKCRKEALEMGLENRSPFQIANTLQASSNEINLYFSVYIVWANTIAATFRANSIENVLRLNSSRHVKYKLWCMSQKAFNLSCSRYELGKK